MIFGKWKILVKNHRGTIRIFKRNQPGRSDAGLVLFLAFLPDWLGGGETLSLWECMMPFAPKHKPKPKTYGLRNLSLRMVLQVAHSTPKPKSTHTKFIS